jgi:hypothetical protein
VSVAERWKKQPFWPQGGWCDTVAYAETVCIHTISQSNRA